MIIQILVMDVDGTLTDGKLYYNENGESMKAFNVKDGYGIVRFIQAGGIPVIITGRQSGIVEQRCKELGIKEVYQGVADKLDKLKMIETKFNASSDQIAYIGDDLTDLECIKYCGYSACPQDAVEEIKCIVDYVSKCKGGHGAVREIIDHCILI